MSCVIDGCYSHSGRKENSGEKIHFHSFPKDENRREEWISRVGKPGWICKSYSRICSKHFSPNDYSHYEFSSKRRLKFDAVPSIDLTQADSMSSEQGQIHSIPSAVQGQENSTVTPQPGYIPSIVTAVPQIRLRKLEGLIKRIPQMGTNIEMVSTIKRECSTPDRDTSFDRAETSAEEKIKLLEKQVQNLKEVSKRRLRKINALTKQVARLKKQKDELYTIVVDKVKQDDDKTEYIKMLESMVAKHEDTSAI